MTSIILSVFVILEDELGSGVFGVVYFAHAVGMGSFLSRRGALKDNKPIRRFLLTRFKKRNFPWNNDDCDVVKTAVKTLKGNQSKDAHVQW